MSASAVLSWTRQPASRLFQFSFLMLFTELTLIRYISANFMFLAFYSNYILLASFLGIAVGFLAKDKAPVLFRLAPILLALVLYLCQRYQFDYQVNINPKTDDLNLYVQAFSQYTLPLFISMPAMFIAVMLVMAALAAGTANSFKALKPLRAYQLEILGSLVGTICFTVISCLGLPPIAWAAIIITLFISLSISFWRQQTWWLLLHLPALTLIFMVMLQESVTTNKTWSPYYKISVLPYTHNRKAINVNGLPQQFVETVADRHHYKPFYFYPYQHLGHEQTLNNVLIIGAGTGGDVAIALAAGAKHVDAVEIDPVLLDLGKHLNLDKPYDDHRVTSYVDDGRAFLAQHPHNKYDLIIIALADSVTLIAGQSSIRLENYLLTLESMMVMRDHLTETGALTMYNYYRTPWIVDRLGTTLTQVFGEGPCLDSSRNTDHWLSVFTIAKQANLLNCTTHWSSFSASKILPATDDHPFFYMEAEDISGMYLFCLLFIAATAIISLKAAGGSRQAIYSYFDIFLMGAAFLLILTKHIIQFALLFGSTWLVNAFVFIGTLSIAYFASGHAHRYRKDKFATVYFVALITSLVLSYAIPNQALLIFPYYLRLIFACILAFIPIYFASLIFATRFQRAESSTDAFAANMCGAVCGGLLEYSALIIGYQKLTLLIICLYLCAVSFRGNKRVSFQHIENMS